jgi:hypothetical protein
MVVESSINRDQRIRERLFDFLSEFPVIYQARQGVGSRILNPFTSMAEVVRSQINPLILYINDLVREIQEGLSYLEALDRVIRFALQNKYRDRILEAVQELSRIERERPYFLWGLASLKGGLTSVQRARKLRQWHRRLHQLNARFLERFGAPEADVDLVPWRVAFRGQVDGITEGTYEYPTREQLEIFRQAIGALERLVREHQLDRWIHRRTYRSIQEDIKGLAQLLFDYGFTVEEISGRVQPEGEWLNEFLNDMILSEIEGSLRAKMEPETTSRHLILLTLLDYRRIIPFRTYYRPLSDLKGALQAVEDLERKHRKRKSLYRRLVQLYRRYLEVHPPLLHFYLEFQFSRAHGDYFPVRDRGHFGVDITQKFILRYYDGEAVESEIESRGRKVYSSKSSGEILELMRLLVKALSNPGELRGRRVYILGHIQSGAMGRVLVGIYKGNIVALKEPKVPKGSPMPLSERARHLEYEARIHSHIQEGPVPHENIVECFGIVEEEGQRYLAIGYHPAETVGMLIRRNRMRGPRQGGGTSVPLTVGDVMTVSRQLLRALVHLKDRHVIHRDLKPANLLYLVDPEGRVCLIKVIDFGVALGTAPGLPKDIHSRQVVGTLGYLAPEMVFREASYASDLYSAGVILYQLLSGSLPLPPTPIRDTSSLKRALSRVVKEPRIPLLKANPLLREEPHLEGIGELVDRMIRRDPTERPAVEDCLDQWTDFWKELPEEILNRPIRYAG